MTRKVISNAVDKKNIGRKWYVFRHSPLKPIPQGWHETEEEALAWIAKQAAPETYYTFHATKPSHHFLVV